MTLVKPGRRLTWLNPRPFVCTFYLWYRRCPTLIHWPCHAPKEYGFVYPFVRRIVLIWGDATFTCKTRTKKKKDRTRLASIAQISDPMKMTGRNIPFRSNDRLNKRKPTFLGLLFLLIWPPFMQKRWVFIIPPLISLDSHGAPIRCTCVIWLHQHSDRTGQERLHRTHSVNRSRHPSQLGTNRN